jgi:hypothetical protein
MAVSPPFDALTALPGIAINKLPPFFDKLKNKLIEKANEVVSDCIKLPKGISCDDPRVVDIKEKLNEIQKIIDTIKDVLSLLTITVNILRIAITVGSSIKTALLAVPLPTPPVANEALQVQNEFVANAKNALKQVSLILTVTTASLGGISLLLTQGIKILSQICTDEDFVVTEDLKNALDTENLKDLIDDTDGDISGLTSSKYGDNISTEWYSNINASKQDNVDRLNQIDLLIEQQRSILENLIEAPSKLIINNNNSNSGIPAEDIGKRGDYYIDETQNKIYGPKSSDTQWPDAINY